MHSSPQYSSWQRCLAFECSLLFGVLHELLLHEHAFSLPNGLHISTSYVCSVRFLAQIFQFLFGCGNPKWIKIQNLVPSKIRRHLQEEDTTHPLNTSCGLAAPDVFFRISAMPSVKSAERTECSPSENPKLSTTGMTEDTVMYVVPSFISSATIRPLRLPTTLYTLPRTSATTNVVSGVHISKSESTHSQPECRSCTWPIITWETSPRDLCDMRLSCQRSMSLWLALASSVLSPSQS